MKAPQSEAYVYVRDAAAVQSMIERLGRVGRVAVDTEADSLHNYFEKVCLIQLSCAGAHYIVDPLCGLDLSDFMEALADKPLIVHGGDYDLRMLRASMGFKPRCEVFDTMIAAQLLGFEQIGLAALVERFFGCMIGKEGQKSDWSRRPLSEKQLHYAVNDTRFLEQLAGYLEGELSARGRAGWHLESCRAMVQSSGRDSSRDPEEAWRIKGAGRLTRRQLAYLRELWRWRDQHARRANLPPFKVLGNEQVLDLIRWADSHVGVALQHGPRLPRNIIGVRLSSLEEAIARAAETPPARWPEGRKPDRDHTPHNDAKEQIDALRRACARTAAELEIAPSTLAPRAALEAIARSGAASIDEFMKCAGLLHWQAELIQGAVKEVLQSARDSSQQNSG